MNQPPQTGKRIVSKGRYATDFVYKMCACLGGLFFLLLGVGFAIGGIAVLGAVLHLMSNQPVEAMSLWIGIGTALFFLAVCGIPAVMLLRLGVDVIKDTQQIDIGIPQTRANAGYLPAPESLVRASEEPPQEQEAILLRAATAGAERQEDQLLRAAGDVQPLAFSQPKQINSCGKVGWTKKIRF